MLCDCPIAMIDCGNRAAIEVKISSDMPLPTPRSVISSPIHMITPVPAVIDSTISTVAHQAWLETSDEQDASELFCPNSAPDRATVISVVDCRTPSAIVR